MGPVDPAAMEALTARCREIYDRYVDVPYQVVSGSTDANIAHSHGVPGICVGTNYGEGLHTRGEWIRIDSLPIGMKIAAELILPYFEELPEKDRL